MKFQVLFLTNFTIGEKDSQRVTFALKIIISRHGIMDGRYLTIKLLINRQVITI